MRWLPRSSASSRQRWSSTPAAAKSPRSAASLRCRRWPSAASAWSPIASAVAIAGAEVLDRPVGLPLVIGDERVLDECDLNPQDGVVGRRGEPLGLEEPAVRVVRPPLPLVDVAEQEQRLASTSVRPSSAASSATSSSSSRRFLELAELHRHVRPPQVQPHAQVGVLVAEDVERARVVAMRLAEALAALGAAGRARRAWSRLLGSAARSGCGQPRARGRHACSRCQATISTNSSRAARQARHPIGEPQVELRAAALRHLPVGDVAHEDVLERVLLLVRDARTPSGARRNRGARATARPGLGSSGAARPRRRAGRPPRPRRPHRSPTRDGRAASPSAPAGRGAS